MKGTNLKRRLVTVTMGIAMVVSMIGCGQTKQEAEVKHETVKNEKTGALLLSINPEIEMEFDENGLVLRLPEKFLLFF